jgi:hypothetical protein
VGNVSDGDFGAGGAGTFKITEVGELSDLDSEFLCVATLSSSRLELTFEFFSWVCTPVFNSVTFDSMGRDP